MNRKYIFFKIIGFIISVVALSLFAYVYTYHAYIVNQVELYTNVSYDYKMIKLLDDYNADEFNKLMSKPSTIEVLSNYYNELCNESVIDYYEILDQSIEYCGNYSNGKEFVCGEINQNIENDDRVTPLLSLQMSQKTLLKYGILEKLSEGVFFENSDYTVNSSSDTIPVILGDDYKKIYKIGDVFSGYYVFKKYKFKVIGFLEQDVYVEFKDMKQVLDNYIIMPAFSYSNISEISKFNMDEIVPYNMYYMAKCESYIRYDNNLEYKQQLRVVDTLNKKYGIIIGHSENPVETFTTTTAKNALLKARLVKWVSMSVLIIITCSIALLTVNNLREKSYENAVKLMNGYSYKMIRFRENMTIIAQNLIGTIIAMYICKWGYKNTVYYVYADIGIPFTLYVIFITLGTIIVSDIAIYKFSISSLKKGK